jgi:hypothetical protein
MATLNIGGRKVTVDDSFLSLPADQQAATVEEISSSFAPAAPEPAVAPAPSPAAAPPSGPRLNPLGVGVSQGILGNFTDEVLAGMLTPIEMGIAAYKGTDAGKGIGERVTGAYDRALTKERGIVKQAQAEAPIATGIGNAIGGMVTGGKLMQGGATLLKGGGSTASMVGRGAAEGTLYGAVAGAGEGEGTNNRIDRAISGGAVGGVAGGALGAVSGALAGRNSRAAAPSIDDLRAAKDAAYKAADDAGVAFTPNAVTRVQDKVVKALTDIGYDPALQPGATVALKRIQDLEGQNVTLTGLDSIRKIASNGYIPGNKSNNKAVSEIVKALDDVVQKPAAADILAGDAVQAGRTLTEARRLASQVFKQEKVADAVVRGERQAASTGSGGNVDNAIRQKLRVLLDKERGFSAEEKAALETAIRGSSGQNLMRLVGKLAPQGNGLMMMLQGGGAVASGGATIPLAVAGAGAKMVADRATGANVKVLDALIRSGGTMPARQLTAAQRAVIEALTREAGPSTAPIR